MIYFDHNATTPLHPVARDAWLRASGEFFANPSSPHRLGARADRALDEAREKLAEWLGCAPDEIVWTSGATESNNMVAQHFSASAGQAWVSAIEHPSVIGAVRRWFAQRRQLIPVTADGVIELDWLGNAFKQEAKPAFVGVMAANNETGVLQPWREAAAICRERGVPIHCDAAQWVGKLPARGLGECDFVSGCAHKFGGPKGVGFLKVPRGKFHALLHGGGQEHGRRAGTEDVAGVAAMVAVLELREGAMRDESALRARLLWRGDFEKMLTAKLPGARIVGSGADRLWNTVSALMPSSSDCRARWVVKLDKLGFAVSTGSACASGREEPSHVLAAMGVAPEESDRVLRFSSGWETAENEWELLLNALAGIAANQ